MTPSTINRQMAPVEWVMLFTLALVWAGSFFFNGLAVRELPTLTIVLGRVGGASLILLLVLCVMRSTLPRGLPIWRAFFIMGFLNNVVPFGLIVWGQGHISSGQAAILNATTPIFTVIVAHLLTADETMLRRHIVGILTGFAGVAVMIGSEIFIGSPFAGDQGLADSAILPAQCALLGAALSYAFASVFGRRFRGLDVAPMVTATGQVTASTVMLLPLVMLIDRPWEMPLPGAAAIMAVMGLASISTAFAYVLFFQILARAGATNLSLVTMLIPPGAIGLGILFLDETMAARHIAGLVLIVAGLLIMDGRVLARKGQ